MPYGHSFIYEPWARVTHSYIDEINRNITNVLSTFQLYGDQVRVLKRTHNLPFSEYTEVVNLICLLQRTGCQSLDTRAQDREVEIIRQKMALKIILIICFKSSKL